MNEKPRREARLCFVAIIRRVILRSRNVVTPQGIRPASIHIRDGAIDRVADFDDTSDAVQDFGELTLMPGVVDSHVHVNEPGRTEWEGFETATHAAAAGGVTTIVDMPLNAIPATTSVSALEAKNRFGTLLTRVARGEEMVITRHDKPVARMIPEGRWNLAVVQKAVTDLRQLQESIRTRTRGRGRLSASEVRSAIEEGRL